MVLGRLLSGFSADDYVLIRTMNLPTEAGDYAEQLPARTYRLPETFVSLPGPGWRRHAATASSLLGTLRARARGIVAIVRSEGCHAIVACTGGDMLDVPAASIAARWTRTRFYPYFFDHWSQQSQLGTRRRKLAEHAERWIVRGAGAVIVPNEYLGRELERRYGARTMIVRNACEVGSARASNGLPERSPGEAAVVYTGAVYAANHDTFRNLITALTVADVEARVHIYTAQSPDELDAAGIAGPIEVHEHLPVSEVPAVHRAADVLFLPLAFDSPYPSLIRTSNPGKMGEYLASGRPILVHAPPDSFVAGYFRRHGCGVVVDELDPHALARELERLLSDTRLRSSVARAARERALADFDLRRARDAFAAVVGLRPLSRFAEAKNREEADAAKA